jgi:hypothetical protein
VTVGEFNGNGKLDFAVANSTSNSVRVAIGDGDGSFAASVDYGVGSSPASVAADNGDTSKKRTTQN